jgi:hypothetical protein
MRVSKPFQAYWKTFSGPKSNRISFQSTSQFSPSLQKHGCLLWYDVCIVCNRAQGAGDAGGIPQNGAVSLAQTLGGHTVGASLQTAILTSISLSMTEPKEIAVLAPCKRRSTLAERFLLLLPVLLLPCILSPRCFG